LLIHLSVLIRQRVQQLVVMDVERTEIVFNQSVIAVGYIFRSPPFLMGLHRNVRLVGVAETNDPRCASCPLDVAAEDVSFEQGASNVPEMSSTVRNQANRGDEEPSAMEGDKRVARGAQGRVPNMIRDGVRWRNTL